MQWKDQRVCVCVRSLCMMEGIGGHGVGEKEPI